MKKKYIRLFGFLCLLFMVTFCMGIKLFASDVGERKITHTIKKVAYAETQGFSQMREDGTLYGVIIDYLDEIAKYTGWHYEYVKVEPDHITEALVNGEVDLVGGAYYNPYLEEVQAYPEYNTGRSRILLLARWEDEDILNNDINSLEGKTIGISQRATETREYLEMFLKMYHVNVNMREFTIEEFVNGGLDYYLENGEVDVIVGRAADNYGKFRTIEYIDAQPHYIVCRKDDQKTLDDLNYALRQINISNPNFGERVTHNNFPQIQNLKFYLNEEEKEYLSTHQKTRVIIPDYLYPLVTEESQSDQTVYSGITMKVFEKISELTGLEFEYIPYDASKSSAFRMKKFFREKKADIVGCAVTNSGSLHSLGLNTSATYVSLPRVFFRNKDFDFCYDNMVLAMAKNQPVPESVKPARILYYDTMQEVIMAVNNGEADLGFTTIANFQYLNQTKFYANIVTVTAELEDANYCFATDADGDTRLLTILNKAINSMNEEELIHIREENQKLPERTNMVLIQELLYANAIKVIICIVLLFLIILTSIIMVLDSKLKSQKTAMQLADAESANKAKSVFLSHMSHDIRTPINGIVGMTHIAMQNLNNPGILKSSLEKISRASTQLETLVNEVLEMSRIESGKMIIIKEPFDMLEIQKDIDPVIDSLAEHYGVEYESSKQIQHTRLIGSSVYIERVIMNLLSNAVKYTPQGGRVKFKLSEKVLDETHGLYVITVSDNGTGMSKEFLEHIFEPFARANPDAGTTYSGTGLGMPIAKELVELMQGTIRIESELEKGTVVTIQLPLEYDLSEPKPEPDSEVSLDGIHILLVEDNKLNSEIASYILRENGANVELAEDGQSAVEMFQKMPAGHFDLILMDLMMPVMDGYAATKAIRECHKEDAKKIPIIAMTANAFAEDAKKCIAAGMNDHMAKPIDVNTLLMKIRKHL